MYNIIDEYDRRFAEDAAAAKRLYNAAVALMDDDLRESLHNEIAPCTDREFLVAYCAAHSDKYGEEFEVN